jgi:membrane-associated protein
MFEYMAELLDLFLNLDVHLAAFVDTHGVVVYGLLFSIIFAETGLVVTPFLPGDSLLFATGAIAATGALDVRLVLVLLVAAAVLGDAVNYSIGRYIGPRVFKPEGRHGKLERMLNPHHLERAHDFFETHGGKAIVLARFVPIVRTFAPFVAGVGRMRYARFLAFDVGGGVFWVWSFGLLGFFFGNQPIVKENFGLAIIAVIVLSLLPVVFEAWRARAEQRRAGIP